MEAVGPGRRERRRGTSGVSLDPQPTGSTGLKLKTPGSNLVLIPL